jgi:hypothetical protein
VTPIEWLFISLIVVFGIIGYSRGISKELGATLPILVGMFILLVFGPYMINFTNRILSIFGLGFVGTPSQNLVIWILYTVFMLIIVLIAYEGITLDYPGISVPGPFAGFVNFMSGLANGYLVFGTIWYYLDELGYPIQQIGLYQPPLSAFAQTLVRFLPLNVLPAGTAQWYLLGFILFLIILRVIK